MHLALYRRFRPKTFDEIIGQDHIVSALTRQVKSGNISHAYLFSGSRGTGKTSSAKIFAKAINCLDPKNGSPCGKCLVCQALESSNNVDIIELDAASNNGVDEIREIREKVKYPPINGKYKVYIIDEVHMLTDSAFNALLKTLEEPPSHAVFILATTEVYKIPQTILSRCMRFDFRLVSKEDLMACLKNIFDTCHIKYDAKSIELIALSGEGSVRDMLSIADAVLAFSGDNVEYQNVIKVLGQNDRESVLKLSSKIFDKDLGGVLETIDEISKSGKNMTAFSKEMTVHFKDLIVIKNCEDAKSILDIPSDIFELYKKQAEKVETDTLIEFMDRFSKIESELKYALSPRVLLELVSLECASFSSKKN